MKHFTFNIFFSFFLSLNLTTPITSRLCNRGNVNQLLRSFFFLSFSICILFWAFVFFLSSKTSLSEWLHKSLSVKSAFSAAFFVARRSGPCCGSRREAARRVVGSFVRGIGSRLRLQHRACVPFTYTRTASLDKCPFLYRYNLIVYWPSLRPDQVKSRALIKLAFYYVRPFFYLHLYPSVATFKHSKNKLKRSTFDCNQKKNIIFFNHFNLP